MIFLTVGTHEQQFDRVIKELDMLKENNHLDKEEVNIQSGYSNHIPKFCSHKQLMSYDELMLNMEKARIVITHGGPGSIFSALQMGKIPVVVPRNPSFGEHVDGHQIDFVKRMVQDRRILAVFDIGDLKKVLQNYDILIQGIMEKSENRDVFVAKFDSLITNLFKK